MSRSTKIEQMALNLDIAPTNLELAGQDIPPEMQGGSLVPLLANRRPKTWRTDFFCEHLFDHPKIPAWCSHKWSIKIDIVYEWRLKKSLNFYHNLWPFQATV